MRVDIIYLPGLRHQFPIYALPASVKSPYGSYYDVDIIMRKIFVTALIIFGASQNPLDAETKNYAYDRHGRIVGAVSDSMQATTIYRYDNASNRSALFSAKTDANRRPIFRFSSAAFKHFYTLGFMEGHNAGFNAEGATFHLFNAGGTGRQALYRCYNSGSDDHFVSTASNCEGQIAEGLLGYAATVSATGLIQLHRCFRASDSDHLITTSSSECASSGYAYESSLGFTP